MASARTALSECLEQNDAWRGQSLRALDEIAKQFPDSEVDINIFNPSAGVMTLFFAASREDGVLYVPNLGLTVYHEDKAVRLYYGCLVEIGEGISFQSVVRKYYDRSLFGLLFTLTWGGYEGRDTQILEDFDSPIEPLDAISMGTGGNILLGKMMHGERPNLSIL